MSLVATLRHGLRLVLPLAIACTIYLYLFPLFGGCAFPLESRDSSQAFDLTKRLHWPYSLLSSAETTTNSRAPFRLLALGDPQLEGDTSIPTKIYGTVPHLKKIYKHLTWKTKHSSLWQRARMTLHDIVDFYFEDIPNLLESGRKRFDLFGNDFYLAHIYRTTHWWTKPTHVTVLGDLLGSQWIDDREFARRSYRFWNRSFRGGERIPDEVMAWPDMDYNITGYLNSTDSNDVWTRRIMNVAGNHDIGYAGDLTEERLDRFEREFGKANYELRFELPLADEEPTLLDEKDDEAFESDRLTPEIRIVVVNDMNLDTPAKSSALQDATYSFINSVISSSAAVEYKGIFTLVLTHIPLYKPAGVCVDYPFFDFHSAADGRGVKEQYLLSADASKGFLEGIWGVSGNTKAAGRGLGRPGLMLNGHDHEGCDTFHYINQTNGTDHEQRTWEVARWHKAVEAQLPNADMIPGRREITVRSMMGDFGGNAGLLSMWFNQTTWEWEHEYVTCPLGTQHFWWLVHIVDAIVLFAYMVLFFFQGLALSVGWDVDVWFDKRVRAWRRQREEAVQKSAGTTKGM